MSQREYGARNLSHVLPNAKQSKRKDSLLKKWVRVDVVCGSLLELNCIGVGHPVIYILFFWYLFYIQITKLKCNAGKTNHILKHLIKIIKLIKINDTYIFFNFIINFYRNNKLFFFFVLDRSFWEAKSLEACLHYKRALGIVVTWHFLENFKFWK